MKREDILKKYGAKDRELKELLEYTKVHFNHENVNNEFGDEIFARVWAKYENSFDFLRDHILEFNFPIVEGMSRDKEYLKAIEEGIVSKERRRSKGLDLKTLSIEMIDTPGGKIPVMKVEDRSEFERIIQAFSYSNEPGKVPKSMGASTYSGYNNWGRINMYRRQWLEINLDGNDLDWNVEFDQLQLKRDLYQDKFIVLSNGPYSAVSNEIVGKSLEEWKSISLDIRKYHEVTHYFTKRVLGSMKNNAIDEVLCDYVGIVRATDEYRAELALLFLGLEDFPRYREGGRLQNYVKLSEGSFKVVQKLVYDFVNNLTSIHSRALDPFKLVLAASYFSLEELAYDRDKLLKKLEEIL